MNKPTFDEHEREVIRYLAAEYDRGNPAVDFAKIPRLQGAAPSRLDHVIERLTQNKLIFWQIVPNPDPIYPQSVLRVSSEVLSVARDLDNRAPVDYWQRLTV